MRRTHYRLSGMVLSDRSIREALAAGHIAIDPLDESCIQPSSVDLHVDRYFRLFRNHTSRVIDVREDQEDLTELVDVGEDPLILHPGEFVLGSTVRRSRCPTTSWPASRASPRSAASACSSTRRPASSTPDGTAT